MLKIKKQVQKFVEETFGKSYTVNGTIALLNRLGFRYKQTRLMPAKYDAHIQKEWKETYEAFIKDLKVDETVVFADGMHPTHNTETSKARIKEGKEKVIRSNTGRRRLNINGAYNPLTQDIIVRDYKTLEALCPALSNRTHFLAYLFTKFKLNRAILEAAQKRSHKESISR